MLMVYHYLSISFYFACLDSSYYFIFDFNSSSMTQNKTSSSSYWKPYFQFQSHDPSFDFLKSFPIQEKINRIEFCKSAKERALLLTTNDKTIKLWNVNHRMPHFANATESLRHERIKSSQVTPSALIYDLFPPPF